MGFNLEFKVLNDPPYRSNFIALFAVGHSFLKPAFSGHRFRLKVRIRFFFPPITNGTRARATDCICSCEGNVHA